MSGNELKIKIGADVSQGVAGIRDFNAAAATIGPTAQKAADGLGTIGPAVARATEGLDRLKNGLRDPSSQASTEGFGAQFKEAIRPIAELEAEMSQLEDQIVRTTNPAKLKQFNDQIKDLNRQINNLKVVGFEGSLGKVNSAANATASTLKGKFSAGAGQAQNALVNLSRVAQDAPFGFIGIANNINPLLESFQRLQAETGGTKGALKALVSSLAGAGGLGLAVGIGSAALTLLGQGVLSFGSNTKKADDEAKKFKDTVNGIISDTAQEVNKVGVLVDFIRRETTSRKERTAAIKELQSIAPAYFSTLNAEKATVDDISKSYAAFSQNVQKSIKARIFSEQLKKVTEERLKLEESINKGSTEEVAINGKLATVRNFDLRTDRERIAEKNRFLTLLQSEAQLISKINDLTPPDLKIDTKEKGEQDLLSKRLSLLEKIRDLTKDITEKTNISELIADVKFKINARDLKKGIITADEARLAARGINEELNKAFQEEAISLESILKVKATEVKTAEIPANINDLVSKATGLDKKITITLHDVRLKILGDKVTAEIEKKEELQKKLEEEFSNAITNFKVNIAAGLGDAIGEALGGANLGEILSGTLNAITEALSSFGKALIAYGIAQKALKIAFKNPTTAIIAGIGLIAASALLKKSLPKFAAGGLAKGPKSGYPVILHGEEMIIPMNKMPKANIGGLQSVGGSVQFAPISISIPGQQLRILLDRVDRSNGRLF